MSPMVIIVLFFGVLAGLLACAVLCESKGVRLGFGIGAFAWACLMFVVAGIGETFEQNLWYGVSAKGLLDESVKALESGKRAEVCAAWKRMSADLDVTYEHRSNFREVADRAVREMRKVGDTGRAD